MYRLPRLALVLAFALLAAAPAHAAPQWLLPANDLIGPAPIDASCPTPPCGVGPPTVYKMSGVPTNVAMDGAGNTTILRSRRDPSTDRYELLAITRPAGGAFGPPEVLSTDYNTAWGTALAVDKQGNAVAAWTTGSQAFVQASVRPAAGTFGPAQQVAAPYSVYPVVALDGLGTVLVLWARYDAVTTTTKVEYTARAPGETFFSPPVPISDDQVVEGSIRVAMNEAGHAVAVWSLYPGAAPPARVQAAMKAPGTPFSSAQTISGTGASNPSVAIDPGGNAVAVWRRSNGSSNMIEYGVRPANGFFPVTGTVMSAAGPGPPQVVMDAQGNAVAAWYRIDGGPWRIESSVRPAGGSFPPLGTDITGESQSFAGPVLTVDAKGDVLAAWTRNDSAGDRFTEAALRPAGGSFGAATTLDTMPYGNGGLGLPMVAMDGLGDAIAVWTWDNIDTLMHGARFAGYDGAGPQLRALQIPSQATAGIPAAFSVSAVDVWSPVASTAWDFGDGSAGSGENTSHTYAVAGDRSVGVTSTDALGNATSATQALSVAAPATGGGADIQAPALSAVGLLRSTFAVAPRATALSAARKKKAKRGSAFRYTLSEAATVRIAIERALPGRRSGKRCAKPSPRLKRKKACTRYAKAGTLTRKRPSGKTTTPFSGRIGKRALKPGRYRATLTATDAAGNRSKARRLSFKIVR